MLTEVKELQNNSVLQLIEKVLNSSEKELTFKAPTGSGKTYMMADFINRVIAIEHDAIFLVSSLSKGDLARQNYEKFCDYANKKFFANIKPHLINSEIAGEERLFIPADFNTYVLPRDLYKEKSRIKAQGVLLNFFMQLRSCGKFIFLIKDECHIATKNLDDLIENFEKIINFSATPKLSRGQLPDVQVSEVDAVNAKLIKTIEWGEENDTIEYAINKFQIVKNAYRDKLNINPCMIIQISNKEKAEEELKSKVFPILEKPEYLDLKWMLIVDDPKKCNTNDVLKTKKIPVGKWKDYVKTEFANIDIIIFKMVIAEGWDIPRACMLFQIRDTKSKQLDEQVIGRVRRNPRLLDFETLDKSAQDLAMTAWVWGVTTEQHRKVYTVELKESANVIKNIKIQTTKLKPLAKQSAFDLQKFIDAKKNNLHNKSIFELGLKLKQANYEICNIIYDYATDYQKWRAAAELIDDITKKNKIFACDYENSMEANDEASFAITSHYADSGNYINIGDWVWKRRDKSDRFSFDSDAEKEWANILKTISSTSIAEMTPMQEEMFSLENQKETYLWGKNYLPNSAIKFEYYTNAVHSSYPDFVMKDKAGRIHIFEVKSINEGSKIGFDNATYEAKILELKRAYRQASKITKQIFYLPLIKDNVWQIMQFINGDERILSKEVFENFVQNI
ncbi:MAG: DEAD/DEAH box helicase family protein [Elusimicrobiota bacterium]|jgi:type III restriction enzyme|nr:DEAD/DEAH box helicase family protein [Elusimicrobiota bacterium]